MSAGRCCACSCHEQLELCREELARSKAECDGLKLRNQQLESSLRQGAWEQIGTAGNGSSRAPSAPMDPVLTDYLPTTSGTTWLEASFQEVADISNGVRVPGMELGVNMWQFSPMQPGEMLRDHVQRQVQAGTCAGPDTEASLVFKSNVGMAARHFPSMREAARASAQCWGKVATFRSEWQALMKNLLAGNYDPIVTRTVLFGDAAKSTESSGFKFITWPAVVVDSVGQRHWGMVQQIFPSSQEFLNTWRLRDSLIVKHMPSSITVVGAADGAVLWQNAGSMATFGVHGRYNTSITHGEGPSSTEDAEWSAVVAGRNYNFVDLVFESNKAELSQMKAAVQGGDTFRTQVQVLHPTLRSLMGMREEEEVHHDVQMSFTRDPVTLQQVYIVAQIDVTAAVLAKREVQLAHAQLEEEKVRTEVLLHRQYELVECLGWVSEVGRSAAGDARAAELIDNVRRQIVGGGSSDGSGEQIELLELLGSGSFGKVYKGLWRNKQVAVKSMVLPTHMNGSEKKERMAIMEAAISSSLSHPNIVQTYTYSLKPVREGGSQGNSASLGAGQPVPSSGSPAPSTRSSVTAFEVQIVLELCDRGTLRDALLQGHFYLPHLGRVNYLAVLEVAADIARGMQHLHACNILHSDLKAANVLLQSSASEAKGVTAKISDFGLSVQMSSAETHVSGLYQGTITHMAPEALLIGQQSNAADMYAFGITLWELYTAQRPYPDMPRALLGHQVTREHYRPLFPADTPPNFKTLVELCWDQSPAVRPSFAEALEVLETMRKAEGGVTPCLHGGTYYTNVDEGDSECVTYGHSEGGASVEGEALVRGGPLSSHQLPGRTHASGATYGSSSAHPVVEPEGGWVAPKPVGGLAGRMAPQAPPAAVALEPEPRGPNPSWKLGQLRGLPALSKRVSNVPLDHFVVQEASSSQEQQLQLAPPLGHAGVTGAQAEAVAAIVAAAASPLIGSNMTDGVAIDNSCLVITSASSCYS